MFDYKKLAEVLEKSAIRLKKMIDGEPKNINPLIEIPEPQMRLYRIDGTYFDNKEEIEIFCKENKKDTNDIVIVDYLGTVAGRKDVISTIYKKKDDVLYCS